MHTTAHVSSLDAVKFCFVAHHRNLLLFDFVFVSMKNVHLIIDACLQQIPCCLVVFFLLPSIPMGTTWSNSILHVFFICPIFHSILSFYFFILQVIRLQRLIRVCKVRKKGLMYQRQYWGEIALSKVREKGSFFFALCVMVYSCGQRRDFSDFTGMSEKKGWFFYSANIVDKKQHMSILRIGSAQLWQLLTANWQIIRLVMFNEHTQKKMRFELPSCLDKLKLLIQSSLLALLIEAA